MRRTKRWLGEVLCLTLLGCPGNGSSPDADADGELDADAEADGGPPPVAPDSEPEAVAVTEWMVALVSASGDDPIERAIENGTLAYPAEGDDPVLGVSWSRRTPRPDGAIGGWSGDILIYAVARVTTDPGQHLLARVERAFSVYANGVKQPADVYGSGKTRVPLRTVPGENLIVVQAYPAGAAVLCQLFRTPDEVRLNDLDLTPPDFVAGETAELPLGLALVHLTETPALDVEARVVDSDDFAETSTVVPGIPGGSVTQLAFLLRPKAAFPTAGETVPVRLHVESPSWSWAYEREVAVGVVAPEAVRRRTFVSPDDGSVQYYGVLPPSSYDPSSDYALVLSTHGAGVEASGQAAAYSARDWNFVVAPTNRRPFGFDWEEWGRANALFALDDAMAAFPIDPTRVYLTGHSMGGHGAWHLGVTTPGRFATVGPSAGWSSFYSYTGATRPTGSIGRARAHSDTNVYLGNLARRGVYIIHGSADDNVPVREGRDMYAAVQEVTTDVVYHEEPGAGHWWDGDAAPGADCVDWPPLFEFMRTHTLDPLELDFDFLSPSPAYSPIHSFVTIQSAVTPRADVRVVSAHAGDTVELTTTNVRSLELDGAALRGRGIVAAVVDGDRHDLADEPLFVGPTTGKRADVYGTFNQAFHRPFCFVHPDEDGVPSQVAAFLASYWSLYGNGHACAVPLARLTDEVRDGYNLIYVGLPQDAIADLAVPVSWDAASVTVGDRDFAGASMVVVFPERGHLSAAMVAPAGGEWSLFGIVPFSSRAGLPDYLVWLDGSRVLAGFFDADWGYDAALADP
ncbi:MAG: prolyl oligopeptidase family serine peptidase [Deltaproteobacteria bacterium]|nr:prolyl oligopeptidase family serine peptidase [Deltaproteobacteria bacterium]